MRNLIIYGGTFDPIHNGHINTAIKVQNHFHFERFLFLPCKIPLLKNKALATAQQRIDMIELALAYQDPANHFALDLTEINRESPSYMVDTLLEFRQRYGHELAITLLMGTDSFHQLPAWHSWQTILKLANILVIKRAGIDEQLRPEAITKLLVQHETKQENDLLNKPQGVIFRYDAGSYDFSSSWVREQLTMEKDVTGYVSEVVLQYIRQNKLYCTK